ncbi:MAG: VOC family protein [Gemmatimonadota bacterium]|nr:VOC family protein [Gemmatimonadota bacterium]
MPSPHGKFVWYELMTSDTAAAIQFYKEIAGWGTQAWDGSIPYTMWTNDGNPIGGIAQLTDEHRAQGIPPHWLPYVGVRNVDETAAAATKLGAKVLHGPEDIPGAGRFAVLQDPQGAVLAIYFSDTEMPAPDGSPRRGHFSWHELTTTDHVAAFEFYSRLFGWEKTTSVDMGPMGLYQMYGQNGTAYGGMFNKTPDMPVPPNWLCYIHVDSVERTADAVTRLGGKIINGPMEVPGGDWIAQCLDPQGATFAVHALKR